MSLGISRRHFLAGVDDALEMVELANPDPQAFRVRAEATLRRIEGDDGDAVPLLWYLSALAAHYMEFATAQRLPQELQRVRLAAMEQSSNFEESL